MKTVAILLVSLALALAAPAQPKNDVELSQHSFWPRVDHFRPQDGRIANFTYVANLEFYEPEGPIFVYINDGGVYHTEWIRSGLVYDVAATTGGALITADHRYVGDNIPSDSASFDDLAFLSVDQALADIAILISTVKSDLGNNQGPVIVWGTGYGATLATFARKKFPHLVDAVFASSALFRAEAIDNNYYDALSMIIRQYGSAECGDRVRYAFAVLESLIASSEAEYLQERLRLCEPINSDAEQEVALLVYRFIDIIAQYIHQNHYAGVQNFCRDMDAIPTDPFNSLLRWVEYAYGGGNQECVNANYNSVIESLRITEWSDLTQRASQTRKGVYLTCTQLGGLKVTSDFALDIFPSNLITEDYQYRFCEDVFGAQYNRSALEGAVESLNFNYGGQDQVISHVIFSNAALDPLLQHGISDYDSYQSGVVYMQDSAPGADLRSISAADSVATANAKQTITSYLTRWASRPSVGEEFPATSPSPRSED